MTTLEQRRHSGILDVEFEQILRLLLKFLLLTLNTKSGRDHTATPVTILC